MDDHRYATELEWAGSTAAGYRDYDRQHTVVIGPATTLGVSADPAFRGDGDLPNPELLLLAAASSCQLLSFLAVAALAHVDVTHYADAATAVMPADSRPMRITDIVLRPVITVRGADEATVRRLVDEAHDQCYVAHSLSAAVRLEAEVVIVDA